MFSNINNAYKDSFIPEHNLSSRETKLIKICNYFIHIMIDFKINVAVANVSR